MVGPRYVLLLACFFLSGLAALIYQTAWTRQFAFVFGTSELAVASVLAAYMGGLAAGAAAAARVSHRIARPVLVYGLLELGIALSALAVPAAIAGATALYVTVFRGSESAVEAGGLVRALFYLACSFVILLVPTGLMGATLPMLARHSVRQASELGSRVGVLYATNTLGAVVGTAVAGFVLLPALGLERTIWVAVGANGLAFATAAMLARGAPAVARSGPAHAVRTGRHRGSWILPAMWVSGAVSFTYEVLWTRLLGHVLGGSSYAFATMLTTFLLGIAVGSAIASRMASSSERAARGFVWAQLGTAALSLLAFAAIDHMPDLSRAIEARNAVRLAADAAVAGATLLPGALCIGATYPLAVRVLARDVAEAGPASARVLAWNTFGAVAGAVGAGFFLIPALGYADSLVLAVASNLILALAAIALGLSGRRRAVWLAAAGLVLLALLRPGPPWSLLRTTPIRSESTPGRLLYYGVGRSATVLVLEEDAGWRLRSNGLPESRIVPRGGWAGGSPVAQWLGVVSSLARPEARTLLVVGLGGGVALETVPPLIESIHVVELEPEVIRANRAVASRRREDPLSDPRIRLVVNDARGALHLTERRYDAIVSQPSHPWTAGASHLYTREFFELARDRLAPGGVLVQWMGLQLVDEPLLRTLVATLLEVFPHVRVYQPGTGLLFLASERPLEMERSASDALAAAPASFAELGLHGTEDVAAALVLDEAGARAFSAGAPVNTDDRNHLQMRSPDLARATRRPLQADLLFAPLDPLLRPTPELDRVQLVRRLLAMGFAARARRVAESSEDRAERLVASGLVALAAARPLSGRRLLERALELDPSAEEARAALVRFQRREIVANEDDALALASPLGDGAVAVIEGWRGEAEDDWKAVRALEGRLASLGPREPLFPDALRLRVGWRLAQGDAERTREAAALVDELASVTRLPGDLLVYARVALAGGDIAGGLVNLFETARLLKPTPADRQVAREALELLRGVLLSGNREVQRQRLEARLRAVLR